ncbi:N-acetylglucosamine-6-phosphate deacetylase [Bifidobacterium choloepi]|uniref:N-acetylglucosamine-6-phosphate deacetylase n=1 Tax=Bifidobacterium choloepi TaxID=2614131 RepID=A0A6I5N0H0_9BIFI|nr:N-acetylglucosamine-6-phosphate deacetylase [Bifidobacterium choloepi]NEG70067.1 N-acetylglucosamine-6-phosphate deacetylase [Bifidobacterium choloepi]
MNETIEQRVRAVDEAMAAPPRAFAIAGATLVDARGVVGHHDGRGSDGWIVAGDDGTILATGTGRDGFDAARREAGVADADVVDAAGMIAVPGYVDIHAHGAWGSSFDDGEAGIRRARAGHMWNGTTRQVLSLITNPLDEMCDNLATVRALMPSRPDILGSHLEGPFLAMSRKGAHAPECLKDPEPQYVEALLAAADGTLRQITIAPELPHGLEAIRTFAAAGTVPAVGHCDADYATAKRAFDAGAGLMTHMFNAMNGLHHREPGPIPAAIEDKRVHVELINDGFHVDDPMVRLAMDLAGERTVFVTDAMAATGCPDGRYKLGSLDVDVVGGHARLVSNGAIAGSTLLVEQAVGRAVLELGIAPARAVEAATLAPARALRLDRPNLVTGAPLGLLAPSHAADVLLLDPATWTPRHVYAAGRRIR